MTTRNPRAYTSSSFGLVPQIVLTKHTGTVLPRRRGRGRGTQANKSEEAKEQPPPRRGKRGRTSKAKEHKEQATPTHRVKRGRPSLAKSGYNTDSEDTDYDEEDIEDSTPPGRVRGRPKAKLTLIIQKLPRSGDRMSSTAARERGRGRPRKSTASYVHVTKKIKSVRVRAAQKIQAATTSKERAGRPVKSTTEDWYGDPGEGTSSGQRATFVSYKSDSETESESGVELSSLTRKRKAGARVIKPTAKFRVTKGRKGKQRVPNLRRGIALAAVKGVVIKTQLKTKPVLKKSNYTSKRGRPSKKIDYAALIGADKSPQILSVKSYGVDTAVVAPQHQRRVGARIVRPARRLQIFNKHQSVGIKMSKGGRKPGKHTSTLIREFLEEHGEDPKLDPAVSVSCVCLFKYPNKEDAAKDETAKLAQDDVSEDEESMTTIVDNDENEKPNQDTTESNKKKDSHEQLENGDKERATDDGTGGDKQSKEPVEDELLNAENPLDAEKMDQRVTDETQSLPTDNTKSEDHTTDEDRTTEADATTDSVKQTADDECVTEMIDDSGDDDKITENLNNNNTEHDVTTAEEESDCPPAENLNSKDLESTDANQTTEMTKKQPDDIVSSNQQPDGTELAELQTDNVELPNQKSDDKGLSNQQSDDIDPSNPKNGEKVLTSLQSDDTHTSRPGKKELSNPQSEIASRYLEPVDTTPSNQETLDNDEVIDKSQDFVVTFKQASVDIESTNQQLGAEDPMGQIQGETVK